MFVSKHAEYVNMSDCPVYGASGGQFSVLSMVSYGGNYSSICIKLVCQE